MRRAPPWALVGLLVVGAGLGMGIGIANQSPVPAQAQISQIINTTEDAGTAHFILSTVSTSTNPQSRFSYVESGEISFQTGDIEFSVPAIPAASGGSGSGASDTRIIVTRRSLFVYQSLTDPGSGGTTWAKDTISTRSSEHAEVLNSFSPFGDLQFPDAIKVVQFADLGHAIVHGEGATKFHFSTSTCQSTTNGVTQRVSSAPTTLWVDSHGRLVEASATQTVAFHSPHKAADPSGRSTTTVTVHLFDFGAPVNVKAPSGANGTMTFFIDSGKCL